MSLSHLLAAVLLVAAGLTSASAADLSTLDRALKDEPKYTTRTPKYCLLVFGPEARTQVWLVHDGDIMHVHSSPDGKAARTWRRVKGNPTSFSLGDVWEEGGKTCHKNLYSAPKGYSKKMSIRVDGKTQIAGWDRHGKLEFAASAKDAPGILGVGVAEDWDERPRPHSLRADHNGEVHLVSAPQWLLFAKQVERPRAVEMNDRRVLR